MMQSFNGQTSLSSAVIPPVSNEEIECAVSNVMQMKPGEQASILRSMFRTIFPCLEVIPDKDSQEAIQEDLFLEMPPETYFLAERAADYLEKFPIPNRIGVADDGTLFLRIALPEKVRRDTLGIALLRLIDSFTVDRYGHIVWRTAQFDPSDPATYA